MSFKTAIDRWRNFQEIKDSSDNFNTPGTRIDAMLNSIPILSGGKIQADDCIDKDYEHFSMKKLRQDIHNLDKKYS